MEENKNTSSDTTLSSTEADNTTLLKAIGMKISQHGIKYFIKPLTETVYIESLESIETKDLLPFFCTLTKGKNYIHFNTKTIHPLVFKENKTEYIIEGLNYQIYGKGDYIAKIIKKTDGDI